MSLGTDRVRLDFNPGNNTDVHEIKTKIAEIIDLVEDHKMAASGENTGEIKRLGALAQTALEDAAMWAVKLVTTGK